MEITPDRWLASIFGHNVFKICIDPREVSQGERLSKIGGEICCHAVKQRAAMYYGKLDTGQIEVVRQFSAAGLYVVDVNVTFAIKAGLNRTQTLASEVAICEVRPEHREKVLEIAGTCFRYSRFHLDPLVSQQIADQIKRDWIMSYLAKERGERLWAALVDERLVGFLAVLASESNGKRIRTIDLIGVDSNYQGRGVGYALSSFFISQYRGDCDLLQVGTQAANIPSMRLYEKLGFSISSTQYVLHLHVSDGVPRV
jgi:ribosomal protein S18 acetylase RimI-like enzyme